MGSANNGPLTWYINYMEYTSNPPNNQQQFTYKTNSVSISSSISGALRQVQSVREDFSISFSVECSMLTNGSVTISFPAGYVLDNRCYYTSTESGGSNSMTTAAVGDISPCVTGGTNVATLTNMGPIMASTEKVEVQVWGYTSSTGSQTITLTTFGIHQQKSDMLSSPRHLIQSAMSIRPHFSQSLFIRVILFVLHA